MGHNILDQCGLYNWRYLTSGFVVDQRVVVCCRFSVAVFILFASRRCFIIVLCLFKVFSFLNISPQVQQKWLVQSFPGWLVCICEEVVDWSSPTYGQYLQGSVRGNITQYQVAEDLFNNLTTFLNTCDQHQTPVELKIALQEDYLHTPSPPEFTDEANNNFVDLTIDSWLTIDTHWHHPSSRSCMPNRNIRLFRRNFDFFTTIRNYPYWTINQTSQIATLLICTTPQLYLWCYVMVTHSYNNNYAQNLIFINIHKLKNHKTASFWSIYAHVNNLYWQNWYK